MKHFEFLIQWNISTEHLWDYYFNISLLITCEKYKWSVKISTFITTLYLMELWISKGFIASLSYIMLNHMVPVLLAWSSFFVFYHWNDYHVCCSLFEYQNNSPLRPIQLNPPLLIISPYLRCRYSKTLLNCTPPERSALLWGHFFTTEGVDI